MDKREYYSDFQRRTSVAISPGCAVGDLRGRERFVVDYLRRHKPCVANLMDIGCLNSRLPDCIRSVITVGKYHGMDLLSESEAHAAEKNIVYTQFDLDSGVPEFDARFDVIVCSEVIEHLVFPDRVFEFAGQCLSADGVLVVTTPNLAFWCNRILLLFGYQPCFSEVSARFNVGKLGTSAEKEMAKVRQEVGGHLRMFTLRALTQLGQCYGLRILAKGSVGDGVGAVGLLTRAAGIFPGMKTNIYCVFGRQ